MRSTGLIKDYNDEDELILNEAYRLLKDDNSEEFVYVGEKDKKEGLLFVRAIYSFSSIVYEGFISATSFLQNGWGIKYEPNTDII